MGFSKGVGFCTLIRPLAVGGQAEGGFQRQSIGLGSLMDSKGASS